MLPWQQDIGLGNNTMPSLYRECQSYTHIHAGSGHYILAIVHALLILSLQYCMCPTDPESVVLYEHY